MTCTTQELWGNLSKQPNWLYLLDRPPRNPGFVQRVFLISVALLGFGGGKAVHRAVRPGRLTRVPGWPRERWVGCQPRASAPGFTLRLSYNHEMNCESPRSLRRCSHRPDNGSGWHGSGNTWERSRRKSRRLPHERRHPHRGVRPRARYLPSVRQLSRPCASSDPLRAAAEGGCLPESCAALPEPARETIEVPAKGKTRRASRSWPCASDPRACAVRTARPIKVRPERVRCGWSMSAKSIRPRAPNRSIGGC